MFLLLFTVRSFSLEFVVIFTVIDVAIAGVVVLGDDACGKQSQRAF